MLFDGSQDPQDPAIWYEDGDLTWAAVAEQVYRAANRLRDSGLTGRRVAVMAGNRPETVLAHVAGMFAGVGVVAVNWHLTAREAAHILDDSHAALLFTDPDILPAAQAAAAQAGVRDVVCFGEPDDAEVTGWSAWLATARADPPDLAVPPAAPVLYTSGTSGSPKAVEIPDSMIGRTRTVGEQLESLRKNPHARYGTHLVVGPLYHTGPLEAARLLPLGIPIAIAPKFDPERVLALIGRSRAQTAVMVPTHFIRMLALPEDVRARYDVSSLRRITHTGAACPVHVKRAMIDWWGPIFLETYGGTESGVVCAIKSVDWLAHPGSVGRCLPRYQPVVVDADGSPVPLETEGLLYFRDREGKGIMYVNDPEKTRRAHLEPGVFTLGEIGRVDEDGFVYITDRESDMVVSGGVNLYPAEVEAVLATHPDLLDYAAIGVPDQVMGESLKALVVARAGAVVTEAGVIGFCRERLSTQKCPKSVDFVDSLPRSLAGKMDKRVLRAAYAAPPQAVVN
jgi:long-chain acyl-CoA synthetase